MKYILTILTLLSLQLNAQTKVSARDYSKSSLIERKADSSNVIVRANGWGYYPVKITKAGYYTFSFLVRNENVINTPALNSTAAKNGEYIATSLADTYLSVKTPTGKTNLSSILIPQNPNFQFVTAKIKLATTTKTLKLSFANDVTFNSFTYALSTSILSEPLEPKYVSQSDFDKVKSQLDSLENQFDKNIIKFSGKFFKVTTEGEIEPTN